MSTKIASLTATIGADTKGFEEGSKKVKAGLDQQAAAFKKFDADATRNAKSYLAYEAQKAKAIANTEKAAAKLAKQEEVAAKAAAKAAEAQRKASLSLAPGIESRVKGLQEFTQANAGLISVAGIAIGAVTAIGLAMDKTIEKVVEYGDEVVKLKTITGQSAEQTSTIIQLADDMRVGYDQLAVSLKFASKSGVDTSINGLAKLSEQYKALAPGIERTEFLTKTFGKTGVDMGKILELDSTAIKNFKANAGQILTEKDLANIKAYNHSLDTLHDKLQSTGNEVGKSLLPVKTAFTDAAAGYIDVANIMLTKHVSFIAAFKEAKAAQLAEKAAFMATTEAAADTGDEIDNVDSALLKLNQTSLTGDQILKGLSNSFTGLLSSMSSIQKSSDDYNKATSDISKSDAELAGKKQHLTYEWQKQVQAGKDTVDGFNEYMAALSDISKAEQDNAAKKAQLDEDVKKATQQRKYDLVENKLAIDGVSTKEFNYLENLKVNYGLVSRAAADQAIAENQAADQLVSSFESTLPPMEQSLQIMQQIAAFNGTQVNFGVNFTQTGNPYGGNTTHYTNPNVNHGAAGAVAPKRDSGGAGIAGMPYMVGTPEIYVPKSDGDFIPLHGAQNKLGTTYNIVIHNPVPTKSEDSIRSALKKLNYTGSAA